MSYSRLDDHAGADQDWKIALSYETIMGAYAKAVSKKSSSSAVVQKPGGFPNPNATKCFVEYDAKLTL